MALIPNLIYLCSGFIFNTLPYCGPIWEFMVDIRQLLGWFRPGKFHEPPSVRVCFDAELTK